MVLAIAILLLSVGGLALGLMLGGRAPETSCSGMSCIKGASCETCPRKRQVIEEAKAHD